VHFVLVWRQTGRWLQVMDPASGRRWIDVEDFRRSLYVHGVDLPEEVWRRFAGSPAAAGVLVDGLRRLGHRRGRERVAEALADPHWRPIAALEAALRMARSLVQAGALARGAECERLIDALAARARSEDPTHHGAIPPVYWTARPHPRAADGAQLLHVRGALLVRAQHLRAPLAAADGPSGLSRELVTALSEPAVRVGRELWAQVRGADRAALAGLALLSVLGAGAVMVQALVFRALFELGAELRLHEGRLGAALALTVFVGALFLLELPLVAGFLRLGRHLEARTRLAFQERLPRLPQRWFGSRPSSDMAERAHGLLLLRQVPALAGRVVRSLSSLAFTALGLCWLDPGSTPLVALAAGSAVFLPLVFQRALSERELLVRSHHGALSRFYLEALQGLVAVRVHGAERALRREHEALLSQWARAGLKLARGALLLRVVTSLAGAGLAITLLAEHLSRNGTTPVALLFGYWALALPALGEQLALAVLQAPSMRNAALRALEPLAQPVAESDSPRATVPRAEEDRATETLRAGPGLQLKAAGGSGAAPLAETAPGTRRERAPGGVALELSGVDLSLGGHAILRDIDLALAPGEHVALVGRSGAGKSSLIALLLGLQQSSAGELRADGERLTGKRLAELRRDSAWVDPAVQLWNRSTFENLVYGLGATDEAALARALEAADLSDLAGSLPDGLATPLGEGGTFLSGGEGQRLRLGRGLLRPGVRLALLDEPFRGLERAARRTLLARARAHWRSATLLCATHDMEETLAFDRVVVLANGRIVEHGAPGQLAADPGSHYARSLEAERELLARGWHSARWTRWRVGGGELALERAPGDAP